MLALCLSLFFVVNAQPPQQEYVGEGLKIKYPSDQWFKQGEDYNFNFHVHNSTNGLKVSSDITCNFHLYNSTGGKSLVMLEDTATGDGDYEFYVLGGNFSEVGEFYYNIYCNSSDYGGFDTVYFQVTGSGIETNPTIEIINFYSPSLMFGSLMLFLIIMAFIVKPKPLKFLCSGGAFLMFYFSLLYLSVTVFQTINNPVISNAINFLMSIMGYIMYGFIFLVIFGLISYVLNQIQYKRGLKDRDE